MKVKVKIVAQVIAEVECDSLEELRDRWVDIYLYGKNGEAYDGLQDLGGDIVSVEEIPDYERINQDVCPLLVGK